MNQKTLDCLAADNASHAVNLLQSRQIALEWGYITIRMRMTDLLILDTVLRTYMDTPQREWAEWYVLSLDGRHLFLHDEELYGFCAMVHEAAEQLPRRTIRWVDFEVTIRPYEENESTIGLFSIN